MTALRTPQTATDPKIRAVIENVRPSVDGGRFPAKRILGDDVTVEADIFADGHDALSAVLLYRKRRETPVAWSETPFEALVNDRWRASFRVTEMGRYEFTVLAWLDHFQSWRRDLRKRLEAGQDVRINLLIGADLVEQAAQRAEGADRRALNEWAAAIRSSSRGTDEDADLALSATLSDLAARHPDRSAATRHPRQLELEVDRERARFSAWYEMFPRSCTDNPSRHGTFKDCEERLPYVASMGFDVLYLPPIHPIGETKRKGSNNAETCRPTDPGSPWAIGSELGGHKSIHPELGSLDDLRHLTAVAEGYGIEIALDIAFQCSPDHPYVREHPAWFQKRPDGTIQFAENPPKKYQDIYPFFFETEARHELCDELISVLFFWIDQGVRIFRVDNPHTKPLSFWERAITEVKSQHPDVIFLSEAFTRPKVMYRLAKLGFSQSYTYFAWRNTRWELTEYLTELTQSPVREFFRPSLWPNTPDILTEHLQTGGRGAFMSRLVLAATLAASYGIYGPAFELMENRPREEGSEEYLDSEKYQIRVWDLDSPDNLRDLIARVNQIRRENPALHDNWSLCFHHTDNEQLICYSKRDDVSGNAILVVVNLDPHHTHSGWVDVSLHALDIEPEETYQVHDLLTDTRYIWDGGRNYVELNPHTVPAHIFRVRRRVRTEQDFDYFM